MAQLSDSIEQFIKELMEEDAQIELKRNELAQHFGCAPSQINYVLATRFSVDHGYIIESRRGGGGYVRIVRMTHPSGSSLLETLLNRVGNSIDEESANAIAAFLYERKLVTKNEALLIKAAVSRNALQLPVSAKDMSVIERLTDSFLGSVKRRSGYIMSSLYGAPGIESVSGLGLMIGIKTTAPASDVVKYCMEKGVLCLTAKDKVRLLPALNIPMEDLEYAIETIKLAAKELA